MYVPNQLPRGKKWKWRGTAKYSSKKRAKKKERDPFRIVEKVSRSRALGTFKQLLFRRSERDGQFFFIIYSLRAIRGSWRWW